MTPIEALEALIKDIKSKPNDTRYATAIKQAEVALRDWKEKDAVIYVREEIKKLTWPKEDEHIVVLFKNRKDFFICYNDGEFWYDEHGHEVKTPLYWLKKTTLKELLNHKQ